MTIRYLIAGATSAIGTTLVTQLAQRFGASQVSCLVRPTSQTAELKKLGVSLIVGDVLEPQSLEGLFRSETAFVGMTYPTHYPALLQALEKNGVQRAFFITSTGMYARNHPYAQAFRDSEAAIEASSLATTILRCTMIYGSHRDRNMHKMVKVLHRAPVFPIFGTGRGLTQPVFLEDAAAGMVAAIESPASQNQDYTFAGPRPMLYREMLQTIAAKLEKRVRFFCVNKEVAAFAARMGSRLPKFPISEIEVRRAGEDKSQDISKAVAELNYAPRPFEDGIALQIAEMRAVGALK